MASPLLPHDPVQHDLPVDAFLIYVCGVSLYALIWLYYGLVHMRAQRSGVALIGYGAVGLSTIFMVVLFIVALIR